MADSSVDITEGSGTTISTRTNASAEEMQVVVVGIDGSDSVVGTDATYGLDVDVTRTQAAARTTDSVAAALQTDAIMDGLSALTPKWVSQSVSASSTDTELVAAVASTHIRVVSYAVQCGGTATDITFESSTTTRIHKIPAGANGGQAPGFNPVGWFQTASGASLTVTTGTGSTTEITLCYVEVPA